MAQTRTPEYGRRLLLTEIDERARQNYRRPFASIPVSGDPSNGFRDISYRRFANAINRCAHWISESVGISHCFETLTYLGPNDLRYQILCMAAAKTGHVTFVPSPSNNLELFLSLLAEADASIFISTPQPHPIVYEILEQRQMDLIIIPELEDLLDESPVAKFPFEKSFEDCRTKPWMLMQTSGSTDVPKIIPLKHGYPTTTDAYSRLAINEVAHRWGNMRVLIPFSPSYVAGLIYSISVPVWVNSTVVLPPAVPLTADIVHGCHVYGHVECSSLTPALITEITKNETYLKALGRLRNLLYTGGPLPRLTAETISRYTKLETMLVATEYLSIPQLPKAAQDWEYFRFNEACGGIRFRDLGEGLHELVHIKDRRLDLIQAAFVTFPHLQEYHTGDIFTKHPTKAGLWKYESRLDDVIAFNNGEKLNPVTLEGIITSCPAVDGCLVIGKGRPQSVLIVEPKDPSEKTARLMKAVWPYVEQANQGCPEYCRINKRLVLFTPPDKPFLRADNGNIQRAPNNQYFAEEINEIYRQLDAFSNNNTITPMTLESLEQTRAFLHAILVNDFHLNDLGVQDDLFKAGLDFPQVISLVHTINAGRDQDLLKPRVVYDNPTIDSLARFLQRGNGSGSTTFSGEETVADLDEQLLIMQKMFEDTIWQVLPFEEGGRRRVRGFLFPTAETFAVPPNKGTKGWLQILGSFLIEFNTWGLIYTFGVFEMFYRDSLLSSHCPSSISWIGTVQGALFLLGGFMAGPLFDRGYFRIIQITAALVFFFALMMLSLSKLYYQIFLSQGILLGISSGLMFNIPSLVLPRYFSTRLGLSLSLAYAGGPFGGVIYPILFRNFISVMSFGETIRIIGVLSLLTLGLSILIICPSGPCPSRQLIDIHACRETSFLTFLASTFLLFAGIFVPFFTTPTFASENLKVSRNLSSDLLPTLNAAQVFGRVFSALLLDLATRFWKSHPPSEFLTLGAYAVCAITAFTWPAVHLLGGFVPWLLIYGFLSGIALNFTFLALPYVSSNLAIYGTRLGMMHVAGGLGLLIGPPVAFAANQKRAEWLGAQACTGALIAGAATLFSWTAREARRGRKARGNFEKNRYEVGAV